MHLYLYLNDEKNRPPKRKLFFKNDLFCEKWSNQNHQKVAFFGPKRGSENPQNHLLSRYQPRSKRKIRFLTHFWTIFGQKTGILKMPFFWKIKKRGDHKNDPFFSRLKSFGLLPSQKWHKPSSQKVTKMGQKVGFVDHHGHLFCQDAKILISGPIPKTSKIRERNTKVKKRF